MYEKFYGAKYDADLDTKEIAKRVRIDIKNAISAGTLPKGLKTSVTMARFAGGSSIDITVIDAPGIETYSRPRIWAEIDGYEHGISWQSDAARALDKNLDTILNAYNFDGSDVQSDYFNVKFYGHVQYHGNQGERDQLWAQAHAIRALTGAQPPKPDPTPTKSNVIQLFPRKVG